jgi:hypothetical protein
MTTRKRRVATAVAPMLLTFYRARTMNKYLPGIISHSNRWWYVWDRAVRKEIQGPSRNIRKARAE